MWVKKLEYQKLNEEINRLKEVEKKFELISQLDMDTKAFNFCSNKFGVAMSREAYETITDGLFKYQSQIDSLTNERDYYKRKYEIELEKRIEMEDKSND